MKRLLLIMAATASLFVTGAAWTGTTEARDWGRPGYTAGRVYRNYSYRPYHRPYYRPYRSYYYSPYYGYPYGRGAYFGGPRAGVYFRY